MIKAVHLSANARKDLRKVPVYIADKLLAWVKCVEQIGIVEVRKIKSYHDEPLRGDRIGQRFIRLSKSYRAIYEICQGIIEFISEKEVNKHDY